MANWLARLFGSRNQRLVSQYTGTVRRINAFEPALQALSDADLADKTRQFRDQLAAGKTVDDLLPEAFAVVREASRRTLGLRHFDVQLIGGMVLHDGKISEMRTGEGKTLVATLAAYLNALPGTGTHIVTVNEYLASRDAEWMGPIFRFLGLTVGVVKAGQSTEEKRAAYAADITYGTNNELGFDYLRDNLAFRIEDRMQRTLAYAIVDEVDSILIDEARTPLIISGPAEESTELYVRINELVPRLKPQKEEEGEGDYWADEKSKQVHLSDQGHESVEGLLLKAGLLQEGQSLYDPSNIRLMHHLNAALRAHALYGRDVEYIVRNGEVIIVDEFTGRTMPGRRWSDGLHQAIEAKEGVRVREENQTVASITFQNFFRMYSKLAGMTGTADTEAFEFQQIYGLEVVVIPTHKDMIRDDAADLVYLTQKDKFEAIVEDIRECVKRRQPVLVGTTSVETSEMLSGILKKEGVAHEVLNAKQHEREAHVVAQAGQPGSVTIATNMAGRGTDIVLGGNLKSELAQLEGADEATVQQVRADWQKRHEEVVASGGLHIVGTERHESRRIDNQLRGRSGRQGDPGSSRFYLSLEDNLMRIFGDPERTKRWLTTAGMKEGEVIESKMLSRQIERAQRKVEAYNFDLRKNLLEYDDVANDQRKVIYQHRDDLLPRHSPWCARLAPHARAQALRRAAHRRHGAARRQDLRDAYRRRQDAGRDAGRVPECAARHRHAHRHGQRVPRESRRGMDGSHLPFPRAHGRRREGRPVHRGEARRLRRRHHLRHEQRARLRLPARQPRLPHRGPHAARARLRDRGRGGLDPDRRGAHAAHHLGSGRGEHGTLRPHQRAGAAAQAAEGRGRRGRLLGGREVEAGAPVRRGPRDRRRPAVEGRAAAGRPEPL